MKNFADQFTGKVWWVTGASSGIGYETARLLVRNGATVVASARSQKGLDDLVHGTEGFRGRIVPMVLDVTSDESVQAAWQKIKAKDLSIDGVLLNAGIYQPMPAEEFSHKSALDTFDVNVLGMTRILEIVIPHFRTKEASKDGKRGHIAVMASLAGWRGLPKSAVYGATKAAVTTMAESLRLELEPDGLHVQVIHPGFVETPATSVNDFEMPFLMTAEKAAEKVVSGLTKRAFEVSFPTPFATIFKVLRCLPDGIYFPVVRAMTKDQ